MKRFLLLLLSLTLLIPPACAAGDQLALPLQDCHRVALAETQLKQRNGACGYLWQIDTVGQLHHQAQPHGPDVDELHAAGTDNHP